MDLGGVQVFVMDHDDFQNECGCEKYPLLKTINRVFDQDYSDFSKKCACEKYTPILKINDSVLEGKEVLTKNCSLFAYHYDRLNVTGTNLTNKHASKCPT